MMERYFCNCNLQMSLLVTKPTKWHMRPAKTDQPGCPPSLIRVFTVRSVGSWGPKVSSCRQLKLWSDWADSQADLSLRWAQSHFVGFVMRQLKCILNDIDSAVKQTKRLLKIIRGQFSIVLHKNVYYGYSLKSYSILKSTHNICSYVEIMKTIPKLSPNSLICFIIEGHLKQLSRLCTQQRLRSVCAWVFAVCSMDS